MKSKENKLQIGRNNWDAMMNMKLYIRKTKTTSNVIIYFAS